MGGGDSLARRLANSLQSTADSLSYEKVGGPELALGSVFNAENTFPCNPTPLKVHDQTFKRPQILILTYTGTLKNPE